MRRLLAAIAVVLGCSEEEPVDAVVDSAESETGASGDDQICSPLFRPFNRENRCLGTRAPAEGVCISSSTRVKGIYAMCAVSPDGDVFIANFATDVRITGPRRAAIEETGWTFAPRWLAETLGVPPASSAFEVPCRDATGRGPTAPPSCDAPK